MFEHIQRDVLCSRSSSILTEEHPPLSSSASSGWRLGQDSFWARDPWARTHSTCLWIHNIVLESFSFFIFNSRMSVGGDEASALCIYLSSDWVAKILLLLQGVALFSLTWASMCFLFTFFLFLRFLLLLWTTFFFAQNCSVQCCPLTDSHDQVCDCCFRTNSI